VRASFLLPSPTEILKIEIRAGETTTSREAMNNYITRRRYTGSAGNFIAPLYLLSLIISSKKIPLTDSMSRYIFRLRFKPILSAIRSRT
jgi:hypothetical protein